MSRESRLAEASPTLSSLVLEDIGNAQLRFGPSASESHNAADLRIRGKDYFAQRSSGAVAAFLTNDSVTVELLLGALTVGARVISLPLPARNADPIEFISFVSDICDRQDVDVVVARDDIARLVPQEALTVLAHSDLRGGTLPGGDGRFELVQFTSGATGQPKGVALDDEALGTNTAAILDALDLRAGDSLASWLPLSHDMGLVGTLFAGIAGTNGRLAGPGTISLMDPSEFLFHPDAWIRLLDEQRVTITASPNFGLRLSVDRGGTSARDLSRLRCLIVGGEIVQTSSLEAFAKRYGPAGFRDRAFCPAYGLAELGLAATMTPLEASWRGVSVDTIGLAAGELRRGEGPSNTHTRIVSSGPPLRGYAVGIESRDDNIGAVQVAGRSIGLDPWTKEPLGDVGGWLHTGDRGFVLDGWLYPTGRSDDYIVVRGRNVYAPSLEDGVSQLDGVRAGRVVAVGIPSGGWVLIAEIMVSPDRSGNGALLRDIHLVGLRHTGSRPDEIRLVRRGQLPLTPSGKLMRSAASQMYLADNFEPPC
jgi:acyl-CoA synthetase (AMP-forming)/AMP-acid ligase II